tara:strand:- start:431 stop:697 length:267 start_codon:yes stop_codon:yes gene_type:complete
MEHISEIIMRLERKRLNKEYQHETVFQRMKRMFPDKTDEEIIDSMYSVFSKLEGTLTEKIKIMFPEKTNEEINRAIDNYDNREKVEDI